MTPETAKKIKKSLPLSIVAFFGGLLNGFIGAGGGVVMILGLSLIEKKKNRNSSAPAAPQNKNKEFAGSAAAVMIFSIVSSVVYALTGRVEWSLLPPLLPLSLLGGAIGGALLRRLDPLFLKFLFSALVLYSGVAMLKKALML